jgi:hypothetical protein
VRLGRQDQQIELDEVWLVGEFVRRRRLRAANTEVPSTS